MAAVYARAPRRLLPGSECVAVTIWICEVCGWAMAIRPTQSAREVTLRRILHYTLAHRATEAEGVPGRTVGWCCIRSPRRRTPHVAPSA
jgi:hypothetical protein